MLSAWEEDRIPSFLTTFLLIFFAGPALVGAILGVLAAVMPGGEIEFVVAMIPISFVGFFALFGAGAAGFNLLLSVVLSSLVFRTTLKFVIRAMFANERLRRFEFSAYILIGAVSLSLGFFLFSWLTAVELSEWPLGAGPFVLVVETIVGALIGWITYAKTHERSL